ELELGSPNLHRTLSGAYHLTDGGFLVGGTTTVGSGDWRGWLLRLDSAFSVVWEKTVEQRQSSGGRVLEYGDTVIFFIWQTDGLMTVLAFDRSGAPKWEKQLPSDMKAVAACLRLDSDGCLLALYNNDASPSATVKIGILNMSGNLQILQTIS